MSALEIRRILFALDAATDAPDSLEAALDIAERLHAELVGLFVEDMNLLRSAALPFVRQISPTAPSWSELDTGAVERQLRARAEEARRRLEESARRRRVAFSFRVARGEVGPEVAAAAADADMVILEGMARPVAGGVRLGSSARAAARHARSTVLVLREGRMQARQFLVAYDGTPEADKAVAVAALLARASGAAVLAAIMTGGAMEAAALDARAREIARSMGVNARTEVLGEPTLVDLCAFARRAENAVLVVGAESPFARGQAADELMDRVSCPLVIVR
jgi:nucleotide-binding universal stress UspA family protein